VPGCHDVPGRVVGPAAARLAEFRTCVGSAGAAQRAGEIAATIELDVVFETFFCLYVGLLVGGCATTSTEVANCSCCAPRWPLLGHGHEGRHRRWRHRRAYFAIASGNIDVTLF
jgi:hypothetical protein